MKIRVGILFGGKSTEHEISVITAVQAMGALNKDKYEIVPLYLTKENEIYTGEILKNIDTYKEPELIKRFCKNVICYGQDGCLVLEKKKGFFKREIGIVDIVLPIVHGYNMEDGCIAGLLNTYGVPYAGSDIYGSVVGQDKVFQKQILESEGIQVPKYVWFYDNEYLEDENKIIEKIKKLNYPVIIKPARQGSSIGIKIAKDESSLKEAIVEAIKYDNKILVEEIIPNMIELNCSVLGSSTYMETSVVERVMGNDEFLSFQDKYIGNGKKAPAKKMSSTKGMVSTNRIIPADISKELTEKIKETSIKTFKSLSANGVVRIDYLYDKKNDKLYVNELNTIPGSLSFYLWMPLNKEYDELLDDIINIAIKRYKNNMKKSTTFNSNVLTSFNGSKGIKGYKGKLR